MINLNKLTTENRFYIVATILFSLILILAANAEAATCDTCSSCDSAAATANNLIQLTSNITSHGSFINIKANNIILDCQGNRIEGNGTSANSSILIDGGFNNTLIRNCNITSSLYGINSRMINLYNLTIINTTIYNNTYGVALGALTNASFSNNTTTNINLINMTLLESDTMSNTTNDIDFTSNNANILNNSEIYNRSTSITITFNDANSSSTDAYTILRNNVQCRPTSCNKISNNPRIFNVTGLSNYTTINLTCGSYLATNISLDAGIINSTGGNICNGDGIILNASSIVFDCNGYEILGNHTTGVGAWFNNISDSYIKNCNVSYFRNGIVLNHSSNSVVFNNTILINFTNGAGIMLNQTGNSNISYNKIETNGTSAAGIKISGNRIGSTNFFSDYNNITNNIIFTFTTLAGSNAEGINLLRQTRFNNILSNNITTFGGTAEAILASQSTSGSIADNNIAFNNLTSFGSTTVTSALTGVSHHNITKNVIRSYATTITSGLDLNGDGGANNVTENIIYTEGATSTGLPSHGIRMQSSGNLIISNNITTLGVESSAIYLRSSTLRNNISDNNLTTYNNNSHILYIDVANQNRINNNKFESTGYNASAIIFGTGTKSTNITSSTLLSTGQEGKGIYAVDTTNANYSDLIINATSYDFYLAGANGTTLTNITSGLLYYINYTNFTAINITLRNENGSIRYENITVNITKENAINTTGNIAINSNFVRVNSTAAWAFNTSANITINSLTFTNPRPLIDLQDSGSYDFCGSCTEISYSSGIFTFSVNTFTTYSSEETPVSGGGGGGGGNGNGGGDAKPQIPLQEEPQQEPQEPEKPAEIPEGTKIIETEEGAIIIHSTKGEGGSYDLILNTTKGIGEILIRFVNATGGITVPKLDIKLTTKGPIKINPAIDVKLPIIDGLNFLLLMTIIIALVFFTEWRRPKKDNTLPHLRYIPYNYPKAYKSYN